MGKLYIQQWKFKRHIKLLIKQRNVVLKILPDKLAVIQRTHVPDHQHRKLCSYDMHEANTTELPGTACPLPGESSGRSWKQSVLHLTYLVFWIWCIHDTSSLFSSIDDHTYYSTCKTQKWPLQRNLNGKQR